MRSFEKIIADLVLLNGKIVTVNSEETIAEGVAVKDGRIVGVGSTQEIKNMVSDGTKVIDLDGKTVLPGIIDAHFHLGTLATYLAYYMDLHVPTVKSVEDILENIKERVKQTPKGRWIIGRGNFWLDQKLVDKRFPTRSELDVAAPDHPVLLIPAGHLGIINSLALKLAGITRDTPNPPFGRIHKDPSTGDPSGVLMELNSTLPIPPCTYEQLKESIKKCIKTMLISQGITSIHVLPTAYPTDQIRIFQELLADNDLPLRIRLYRFIHSADDLDCIVKLGFRSGFGNERLRFGGIKFFLDGEWESGCAAMNEPYTLETFPSLPQNFGCLTLTQEELTELVVKAHKAGLQISVHAAGDRAIDMFLTAVETAQKETPRKNHRHRAEHAGIVQLSPEQIERIKELGVIPSPQPQFLHACGDFFELLYGKERTKKLFLFKTLIDKGFRLPGSSDSTGTQPEAVNPFWGIWCTVARKTFYGKILCPEEKISVMDAIRMFTINSAYAGFEEDVKGSIELGKLGDMIVLSEDPLSLPIDKIKDIKVEMTIVDGKIVYSRNN